MSVGQGRMKPARAQATAQADDHVLCDLDAVISSRVTFIFRGQTHALLPITTERFFDFWQQVSDFQEGAQHTPAEVNTAYFRMLHAVCETITMEHVREMTVVQKANLLNHLVSKIVGNRNALDDAEKKSPKILTTPQV